MPKFTSKISHFPAYWPSATFDDLISANGVFCDGDWIEAKDQHPDGDVRLIQLSDIGDGVFKDKSDRHLTFEKSVVIGCTYLSQNDLLIARLPDPLGRACLFPQEGKHKYVTAVDICIVRLNLGYAGQKYFMHLVNCPQIRAEIDKYKSGSTRKRISRKNLARIALPVAPLPEQAKIVSRIEQLFSELDNGIANLKKAQEQLKTYRQAVLKHAFEGKLTEEWRAQQIGAGNPPKSAENLLEQIKAEREKHYQKQLKEWEDACRLAKAEGKKKPAKPKKPKELAPLTEDELAELPELPKGWAWVKTFYTGYVETGTTPSKKSPKNYGNTHPFYKPTDLNQGNNVRKADDNLSEVGYSKARSLPTNSILVTCIGATIGKTGIIRKEGAFNQQINAIIPFKPIVPEYIYYQAICNFCQAQIKNEASSTTLPILNKSKFENLFLALPPYEEQKAIVSEIESRLSVCEKLEQTVEDSLKKAEALRQSILKRAFSGELTREWREKHPELISGENSAERLLEKIKAEKAATSKNRKQKQTKRTKKK